MRVQRGFSFIELLMVTAVIAILAGLAVPHLRRVQMTANEKTTMASLRTVFSAQAMYHARYRTYADLGPLVANKFLDDSVGSGQKSGYAYSVSLYNVNAFQVVAVPLETGVSGEKGFYIDETGVIRYTEDGSAPTAASPAWQ